MVDLGLGAEGKVGERWIQFGIHLLLGRGKLARMLESSDWRQQGAMQCHEDPVYGSIASFLFKVRVVNKPRPISHLVQRRMEMQQQSKGLSSPS